MSALQDLIKVKYEDQTNYVSAPGDDILGCVINHYWGPADKLQVLTREQFFQFYPDCNSCKGDEQAHFSYATVKKALEGVSRVEVYRPSAGRAWHTWNISKTNFALIYKDNREEEAAPLQIYLKYPGNPPVDLIGALADKLELSLSGDRDDMIVTLFAQKGTGPKFKVEEYEGSLDPRSAQFIGNMMASSQLLSIWVESELTYLDLSETAISGRSAIATLNAAKDHTTVEGYFTAELLRQQFGNTLTSDATLLISPKADESLDQTLVQIASDRQDMMAVVGYSTTESFTKDAISSRLTALRAFTSANKQFSVFLAGREELVAFGQKLVGNCTGGWVAATAAVAASTRVNQPASAFSYGAYSGSLLQALTFDEVAELHELGVNSVFSSYQGPMIWGVKTLYKNQLSYFGKLNCMRVIAAILRQVFPLCYDALHTDAAANPVTRTRYNVRFNGILSNFAASQDIKGDSFADCGKEINSDVNSLGGETFNLLLSLHLIKVVERVNIKVVATDSSVTAEII